MSTDNSPSFLIRTYLRNISLLWRTCTPGRDPATLPFRQPRWNHTVGPSSVSAPHRRKLCHTDSAEDLHKEILHGTGLSHICSHSLRYALTATARRDDTDINVVSSSMAGCYNIKFRS